MEGFVISKEIEELVLKNVHGEITDKEFKKLLCEIAEKSVKSKPNVDDFQWKWIKTGVQK